MTESTKLEAVTGQITVTQDRLKIIDDDKQAALYARQKWDNQPLGSNETHATIELATENGHVSIALDAEQLDALVDALSDVQEAYDD